MKAAFDAVIVGGGPSGSFAAYHLAKNGAAVAVLEEHSEIGVPSHCAGHVSIKGLQRLGLHPLPSRLVENTFLGAVFYSPKDNIFTIRFPSPVTCVVNRALFDKHIAELAEKAGATYNLNSRADSFQIRNDLAEVTTVNRNGKTERQYGKIIVDAEGISSRLLRQSSLPALDPRFLVNGVETEVEGVEDVATDSVEVYLGSEYAPGFYAWLIPKKNGQAKVGLATQSGDPRRCLQQFMQNHPAASRKLCKSRILQTNYHPISLGGPISRVYSHRFLAVGDAASQVKPTTGGGIIFGLTCAGIAAMAALESLKANDFSPEFLSSYQTRCAKAMKLDVSIMLTVRRMLNALSDKQIDDAIEFFAEFGLDRALMGFQDIDHQGQSLLRAMRNPRMLLALSYFAYLYLSATF